MTYLFLFVCMGGWDRSVKIMSVLILETISVCVLFCCCVRVTEIYVPFFSLLTDTIGCAFTWQRVPPPPPRSAGFKIQTQG